MPFNYRAIFRALGFIIAINGVAMMPSLVCAYYYHENKAALALGICGIVSLVAGILMYRLAHQKKGALSVRDGYLIVSASWILCSLIGAIPYVLSGEVPLFIDALFESVSGYTTTGATVVSDWEFTHGMLLWQATTNWLGGMAILMFIISVLPMFGTGGQRVAYAETSWSSYARTSPRISDLSKTIFMIYISLSVASFILLALSPMNRFEALINSLGSVSTAGLLLHPGGIEYYNSFYIESVISAFTILASINFVMYLYLIQRNFRNIKDNVELRVFLSIIIGVTGVIALNLFSSGGYDSLSDAFRHAFFQVTSIATTSGYTIGDPGAWPVFSKALLFSLFFIGGCAASTSGSIKVIRIIVLFKLISRGFIKRLHSHAVCSVKMGKKKHTISHGICCCGVYLLIWGDIFDGRFDSVPPKSRL
jgi:trk system potassium uptake protein